MFSHHPNSYIPFCALSSLCDVHMFLCAALREEEENNLIQAAAWTQPRAKRGKSTSHLAVV